MDLTNEQLDKIFILKQEGNSTGKIAQKMRLKKAVINEALGEQSSGLGDIVAKVTEVTGIKKVVDALVDDCGCAARAEVLNELFPNRKLNNLEIEQFEFLKDLFSKPLHSVSGKLQKELVSIYNHIFNAKRVVSNCSPCVAQLIEDLKRIYERAAK